jgi:hypothetical protein
MGGETGDNKRGGLTHYRRMRKEAVMPDPTMWNRHPVDELADVRAELGMVPPGR